MSTTESAQKPSYNWTPRARSYDEEFKANKKIKFESALKSHPLKGVLNNDEGSENKKSVNIQEVTKKYEENDPLSFSDPLDPLTKLVADYSFKEKQQTQEEAQLGSSFEPWSFKRSGILAKYTTSEKLSMKSSFLTPPPSTNKAGNTVPASNTGMSTSTSDKIKDRLEQLDQYDDANVQEMINLSQQDYVKRIEELNNALLQAWKDDERVKSLKIVIQCSKLLSDVNVVQFYPSKFVLITDILDTFGKLVYERIKLKSVYMAPGSSKPQPLPERFSAEIVPAQAKETCRNWFFKISSIRELLPRIYVEASILKCMNFLQDNSIAAHLDRLINLTAGIGDPLVAAYTNCYICRVGVSIDPKLRDYQIASLENLLYVFKQISTDRVKKLLSNQNIDYKNYLELYCPAIDWILQCVCNNRPVDYLNKMFEKCRSNSNNIVGGLLTHSIMSSFEPTFVSSQANKFIEMIKECDENYFPKYLLFRNLGMCLVFNDSTIPNDLNKVNVKKEDLQFLNDVWKVVAKFTELEQYMSCAEIWIEYTLKNFTKKEVNLLLGDIIKHVQPDRKFEKFYPQLQSIVSKTLEFINDFNILFSIEKFLQFLDLFQKESIKVEVCKSIAHAFLRNSNEIKNDVVIINSMMQICKSMHDYVNALTLDDEKREISHLICSFINKVQLSGKDQIEQYLDFCSEARASFSNLDNVIMLLVHKVNNLTMEILKIVEYNHSKKTAAFVRACLAYSFITIPSLTNPLIKLQLYLECAQIALLNQCLSQCDAFLKAAISLVPEIPRLIDASHINILDNLSSTYAKPSAAAIEKFLQDYLCNLLSTLLIIPDNPEQGGLYLLNGVLNVIQKHYPWESIEIKYNLLVNFICLLSAMKQENYIHHIPNVESNDTLYGSDAKFLKELNKIISSLLEECFEILKTINPVKQSQLSLDMLNKLITHGDFKSEECTQLAGNLWSMSLKNSSPTKLHEQIRRYLKIKVNEKPEYKQLLNKLSQ